MIIGVLIEYEEKNIRFGRICQPGYFIMVAYGFFRVYQVMAGLDLNPVMRGYPDFKEQQADHRCIEEKDIF
jgi:hypothetical protein